MTNFSNKTLESFYLYDQESERIGYGKCVMYAVFEDGHIEHRVVKTPAIDDIETISIDGRIVINLHRNSNGFDVNYYHDVEEGSEASVYDGKDYHCEVRTLEHYLLPKDTHSPYNSLLLDWAIKRDGAKYFAKWAKGYSWKWSV